MNRATSVVLAMLLGIVGGSAYADRLAVDRASQDNTGSVTTPARGATKEQVRQRFGRPAQIFPAVGQPPIARWSYPRFVVYFERNRVIHSVELSPEVSGKTPLQNTARNE